MMASSSKAYLRKFFIKNKINHLTRRNSSIMIFYRFVRQNLTQKVLDQGSINDPGDFVEDFLSMVCVTKACTRFEYNYAVKSKGSTLT